MSPTELAKALASELLSGNSVWLFLLLTALFAGIGSYFGKYLGIKGANLATKEDFHILQNQLSASTRLVEGVKSEFARIDWVSREWSSLRIKKIEELVSVLHDCHIFLDAKRNASIECKTYLNTDPFNRAITISQLYLPELSHVVAQFIMKCRALDIAISKLAIFAIGMQKNGGTYNASIWNDFTVDNNFSELISFEEQIRVATNDLLKKIVMEHQVV